jgi:hypothetical protein
MILTATVMVGAAGLVYFRKVKRTGGDPGLHQEISSLESGGKNGIYETDDRFKIRQSGLYVDNRQSADSFISAISSQSDFRITQFCEPDKGRLDIDHAMPVLEEEENIYELTDHLFEPRGDRLAVPMANDDIPPSPSESIHTNGFFEQFLAERDQAIYDLEASDIDLGSPGEGNHSA